MNCSEVRNRLDDYIDGYAPPAEHAAIGLHARRCPSCAALLEGERELLARLRGLPVPEPDMRIFSRAIAGAARAEEERERKRRHWNWAGAALAASVVMGLGLGLQATLTGSGEPTTQLLAQDDRNQNTVAGDAMPEAQTPQPTLAARPTPDIVLALNEERELSLALESQQRIEEATFIVVLPEGVELSGYPGQREITWIGSLESGKNLLVLPLRAQAGSGGELAAHIMHTERRRSLILHAEVITPPATPALPVEPVTVM